MFQITAFGQRLFILCCIVCLFAGYCFTDLGKRLHLLSNQSLIQESICILQTYPFLKEKLDEGGIKGRQIIHYAGFISPADQKTLLRFFGTYEQITRNRHKWELVIDFPFHKEFISIPIHQHATSRSKRIAHRITRNWKKLKSHILF